MFNDSKANSIFAAAAALIIVFTTFWLIGNMKFGLGDEGHLWYGALQTGQGQVPILDFRSYDPGRYYWVMAWGKLIGDGILPLRLSALLFYALGLSLVLLKFCQLGTNRAYVFLIGVLLTTLAFPNHKLFEIGLVLSAIFFTSSLLEQPTIKAYVITGIFVGVSAFFARNLGVYFVVSIFAATIYTHHKTRSTGLLPPLLAFSGGIAVGYLPILLMLVFIPGFASSFMDSIFLMLSPYAPVLPLHIPWGNSLFISLLYVAIPTFYIIVIVRDLQLERTSAASALILACAFVGIPVIHHIVTRADMAHLAQGMPPFLIALLALPFALETRAPKIISRGIAMAVVLLITVTVGRNQLLTTVDKLRIGFGFDSDLMAYDIRGETLWINESKADYLDAIKALVNEYQKPDTGIWFAPLEPGLYPMLGKHDPTWDPYPLFPVKEEHQQEIIDNLLSKEVGVVLINNRALDDLDSRRFSKTHPVVWNYLQENFVEIADDRLSGDHALFVSPR